MLTREELHQRIADGICLLDGATGSNLMKAGMPRGSCTELWVLENPAPLVDLQRRYAQAGSQILYAPTFQAQPIALERVGLADQTEKINAKLVELTRSAAPNALVAGDLTTLATYTGQNVGANKMDRVRQGAVQGVLISFGLTSVLALIVYFCADKLPGLFALGKEASEYSQEYLKSIAFVVVILSLYVPLFGVFQGTRHVMVPTVIALCALTLRVIVTFVFKDNPEYFGHTIIWWNGLFGFSTGCIMAYIYYFSGRWRSNALVK